MAMLRLTDKDLKGVAAGADLRHVVEYITNDQNVSNTIPPWVFIRAPEKNGITIAISDHILKTLKDSGTGKSFKDFAHKNGFSNSPGDVTATEISTVIGLVPDWELSMVTN